MEEFESNKPLRWLRHTTGLMAAVAAGVSVIAAIVVALTYVQGRDRDLGRQLSGTQLRIAQIEGQMSDIVVDVGASAFRYTQLSERLTVLLELDRTQNSTIDLLRDRIDFLQLVVSRLEKAKREGE